MRAGLFRAVLVVAVFSLAGTTWAQNVGATSFDLERLVLNPGGRDGLVIGGGDLLDPATVRFSLLGHYEHSPLVLRMDGQRVATLVDGRVSAHLTVGFGVTKWLEIGAQLPVVLWQGGGKELSSMRVPSPTTTVLGAPWLQARISAMRELDGMPLDLSVDILANVPVAGPGSWAGDASPSVYPRIGLGKTFADFVRVGFEGGAWIRGVDGASGLMTKNLSPTVQLGVGATTVTPGTRFEVSLRGGIPTNGQPVGGELLAGIRHPLGPVELILVGGPGFGSMPGTPAFRVLAGLAFPGTTRVDDVCRQNKPHGPAECPDLDDDGDGVSNVADTCPLLPGVASAAGCPDGDGDGVKDADDQCPGMAGPASNGGCPDADQDGVRDDRDECPDRAGPAQNNGCPWPDSDGDGVLDRDDACPKQPAPGGCPPPPDGDKDGVPDAKDQCPDEAGTEESGGCPAAPAVKLEGDRLIIREKIYFDTSKATIQPRSFEVLGAVARVLKAHPEVSHVFIDGHTDGQGARSANLALSKARAESVKAWLADAGVDGSRLDARGFGPDKPIADNKTAAGREQNRRVEFLIETGTTVREIK